MIALVSDDDVAVRIFLKKLLKDKFEFEVIEAQNGIEAIEKIQKTPPDIILLDMAMPYVSGLEFLEAIRENNQFQNIPVIVLSAIKNKVVVERLIELGIRDYIVKPLNYQNTYSRLRSIFINIFTEVEQAQEVQENNEENKHTLLIADNDIYFRQFISKNFSNRYKIVEATDGAMGLKIFLKYNPDIVLIGEGIELFNETVLAGKIKEYDNSNRSSVYLCMNKYKLKSYPEDLFDGFIKKSFNVSELENKIIEKKKYRDSMLSFLEVQVKNDSLHAIEQVFELMSHNKISFIEQSEMPDEILETGLQTNFIEQDHNLKMKLAISSSESAVKKLGQKVTSGFLSEAVELAAADQNGSGSMNLEKGIESEIFRELLDIIAGRLCSAMKSHGIVLTHLGIEQLDSETIELYKNTCKILVPFRTDEKDYFLLYVDYVS